ncbi:hypothetical protein SDC9_187246 [bioreactor metagenome]|uniref:Uncharacterized protein n=1 Tax=bioreactor metagenome TaxID=1076179 RepID=A0A645HL56_9ZZZZ
MAFQYIFNIKASAEAAASSFSSDVILFFFIDFFISFHRYGQPVIIELHIDLFLFDPWQISLDNVFLLILLHIYSHLGIPCEKCRHKGIIEEVVKQAVYVENIIWPVSQTFISSAIWN